VRCTVACDEAHAEGCMQSLRFEAGEVHHLRFNTWTHGGFCSAVDVHKRVERTGVERSTEIHALGVAKEDAREDESS